MIRYRNVSGQSGVAGYSISTDNIIVQFHNGGMYKYSYSKPGRHEVEQMKSLAERGRGLNTFINTRVRERYERKLR